MELTNGKHQIRFIKGKLYIDDTQIAGEGITPQKDVIFEFFVNKVVEEVNKNSDSSVLEVNVHDTVSGKDLGPGQRK